MITYPISNVYFNNYVVTIYKSLAGRFCIRHPKGTIHSKDFASLSYMFANSANAKDGLLRNEATRNTALQRMATANRRLAHT